MQARSTRNRGTRRRVEGYGLSLEAWSSSLPAGIRLQRPVRAAADLDHRHGQPCRPRHLPPAERCATVDRGSSARGVTRRRGPLPARRGEGCAREGPAPFWSFPRSGAAARAPQATTHKHSQPLRASTIGLLRASPCAQRGGNRKARFPPRALLSRPLRYAMGRCPPSRPRPTARDQRQRPFPPMVGSSSAALASDLCELTAPSSKSQASSRIFRSPTSGNFSPPSFPQSSPSVIPAIFGRESIRGADCVRRAVAASHPDGSRPEDCRDDGEEYAAASGCTTSGEREAFKDYRYDATLAMTKQRLRPSLADEAHGPLRRRGEGCAREGPAPFWSFPRLGAGRKPRRRRHGNTRNRPELASDRPLHADRGMG